MELLNEKEEKLSKMSGFENLQKEKENLEEQLLTLKENNL